MRKEDDTSKYEREAELNEEEDLLAHFPDPETDERLRTPGASELPPVPEITFTRPDTQTARGTKPKPRPRRPAPGTGGLQSADAGSTEDEAGEYRNMGIASTIGFSLVGSILAGTLLGWLADRFLLHSTTTPWGLIVGFMAGVLSGFVSLIRVTNRLNK
jgi:F0F1-type ATP synthase assembly protein I